MDYREIGWGRRCWPYFFRVRAGRICCYASPQKWQARLESNQHQEGQSFLCRIHYTTDPWLRHLGSNQAHLINSQAVSPGLIYRNKMVLDAGLEPAMNWM